MRRTAGLWVAVGLLVALAVGVIALAPSESRPPFDVSSSEPDGYRAIALLLADAGVQVGSVRLAGAEEDDPGGDAGLPEELTSAGSGSGIVVPVEEYLEPSARDSIEAAAERGATVVVSGTSGFFEISEGVLKRSEPFAVRRGFCDMVALEELRSLDDVAGSTLDPQSGDRVCFDSGPGALVTEREVGEGRVVELSSPYLWANARLQPDKEDGGRALDNGPMAVALLGDLDTVTFVVAEPGPEFIAEGSRNPIELIPLPVKMALLQGVGAFLIYALWRSRRLGRPVSEEMPVEIAGSELTEAVGGLLRRRGSASSAARVLREQVRRDLGTPLGAPPGSHPQALVSAVAARTGRDPGDVQRLLFDGGVSGAEELVALTRELDQLKSEVLDVQPIG